MRANEIELNQDFLLVKMDKLKTFKHIEVKPIYPDAKTNALEVVNDDEPEELEVQEVERTLAYIFQRGTVLAIGGHEESSPYKPGDKVFIRQGTGVDFQWIGNPKKKDTCPKLLKKYEIIGKVI